MSEFFKNRIDTAHALIDEQQYRAAVELILNLKTRIHAPDLLTKINLHDTEVEKEYNQRYQNIGIRGGDPYQIYTDAVNLEKWRAQEYLKFYDMISRDNDLQ